MNGKSCVLFCSKSGDERHATQLRQLELQFLEQVPDLVYTGKEIKGGGNHLMVELVDPLTRSRVSSGPEASAKVELMVLNKDDDDDDVDGHSKQEEFEDVGKPLLTKDHVKLKDGIAVLDNIKFKHKAKWTKSCRVILMARANINGIIVKAETEPFSVRDGRTNLYKKRDLPSLSDEVFRLRNISRGSSRHKRLIDAKVHTVAEFLRLLNMNPHRLKQILKLSAKQYKVLVNHAKTCPIGENLYMYNSTVCGREVSAIFNVIGCLRGLLYADKYVSIDKLSEDEKVDACKIMASAFLDLDNAQSIENESSIAHFMFQSSNADGANTSSSPRTENADGRSFSPEVPAFEDGQSIQNESSISHLASGSSKINGSSTSSSLRTKNASNLFPRTEVPTFEHGELIEIGASTTHLANVSNSPSAENARVSNFSTDIFVPAVENVQIIENENETCITLVAPGSSNAIDANTSSISRIDSITGSNFGVWKMIDGSDNASASTMSRHLSPVHSFGRDPFILFPANNMDILGLGIEYPIYSRSASEELGEQPQLFMEENSDKRVAAFDKHMTGNHRVLPSSILARKRWQMAIGIVAPRDMQAQKRQRLK